MPMNASLWHAAAYQPDQDWDEPEDEGFVDGCPHCEQAKAGKKDVSKRFWDAPSGQMVHALYSAWVEDGEMPLVACQGEPADE